MSVIIAAHVREGLVIASDTRTTVKDNGNTLYKDDAVKIVPFPNRCVVAHCGDANILKDLTVNEFLYKCRTGFGNITRIFDLPMMILNEFGKLNSNANVTFLIAGYMVCGRGCSIFTVETKSNTISMNWSDGSYGASYRGLNNIADAIMDHGDYQNMSFSGCKELVKGSIDASILSYKYRNPQSVGGHCDMYVISSDDSEIGYVRNGKIVPDKKAPNDAYDLFIGEQVKELAKRYKESEDK